jgi:secreted Zn-dependent insulinase-like peptidase
VLEVIVHALFLTQARDEVQIGFVVLHAVVAVWVQQNGTTRGPHLRSIK